MRQRSRIDLARNNARPESRALDPSPILRRCVSPLREPKIGNIVLIIGMP
jgi:hypothetical protein